MRKSVAMLDTQGAIRGTMRDIIAYAAGTREIAEKVSSKGQQKHLLSVCSSWACYFCTCD